MTHGTRRRWLVTNAAPGGTPGSWPMLRRLASVATLSAAALALLAACPDAQAETPLPPSGEVACERAALGACDFADPVTHVVFSWPHDWPVRRLRIVTETGPQARGRQRDAVRWISLEYLPDDPTQPEAPLFSLAVVARREWIAQSERTRATASVEVATGDAYVVVASVPGNHPYPVDSRDADIYQALLPTPEQVSGLVRFADEDDSKFIVVRAQRLARSDVHARSSH